MSTKNNADLWTVAFVDFNFAPATPSSDISWQVERNRRILDMDGNILPFGGWPDPTVTTTQPNTAETSEGSGVYTLSFTPRIAGEYSVKAWATVGGEEQAVPATMLEVER